MDWTYREAETADYFANLDLQLEGILTHTASGPTAAYRLTFDGRPYALPGGKTFPTIAALEEAYRALLPTFRLHAACCHRLMLDCFGSEGSRAAVEQWVDVEALPARKPIGATFPWTSAEQRIHKNGGGRLCTFGHPWTGVNVDDALPEWAQDDEVCARFDPARPRIYLDALRRLLEKGEALWLENRMASGSVPAARPRL
ncbi:hypothetical protein KPL74_08945 [Bacillus sp. NP157]|nr:hypothetical protein KPL74_08945 [Bacillus sp. NP157]